MKIGTFRRNAARTLSTKGTKTALKMVFRSTPRTQITQGAIALKSDTGRLLQATSQYLLGAQMTQEMKDHAFDTMGDIGFDLAVLTRVLKVKLPSVTKKVKLTGTRGAALLQLDSLATDIQRQAALGLFISPKTKTTKKLVAMPQKGGAKEERDVEVVDGEAETAAEQERQTQMRSFLTGAVDVFWRLCFDMFGQPPQAVLDAKFGRMKSENPGIAFDLDEKKPKGTVKSNLPPKKAKKAKPEPVSA